MEFGIVIVTYNRLEKLKKALLCFDVQSYLPTYVIVVDNASNDGTNDYLKSWVRIKRNYEKIVVTNKTNCGGSGGFYRGLVVALNKPVEWIWLSDDDAFPETDALEQANVFLEEYSGNREEIASICGEVINKGSIDLAHRKNMVRHGLNVDELYIPEKEYDKRSFQINCFSYVGCIIRRDNLISAGLPIKDYFLWWDDTEHSLRISQTGKILCVPAIKIHHDVSNGNGEFSWKTYYGFRNMTDLFRRHFSPFCYYYFMIKMTCKTYLLDILGKDKEQNKAIRCALRDCRHQKFGIHEIYKPGWAPNSNENA